MRPRPAIALLALVLLVSMLVAPGAAAAEPGWHSETPVATGIGVPAPLGPIGDIEFYAPNRGVLITGGNDALPAGVYAYDGTGWHLYSTVCGSSQGKIAWAGPDDFWTVSDYATKQEGESGTEENLNRTLCHFVNGQVVASYAEPVASAAQYPRMYSAACAGPAECWFAGEVPPETDPNPGAFHLHWDGGSLTAIPSLTEPQPQIEEPKGRVTDLAYLGGSLFESATEAPFLRRVVPGLANPFQPVPLPEGAEGPYRLAGDGSQLWAVAEGGGSALRSAGAGFETVPLPEGIGPVAAVAPEPFSSSAWLAGIGEENREALAAVTKVSAGGKIEEKVTLPTRSEGLDAKGSATQITCPAAGQCWMATNTGWLFHLGGSLPQDTDPAMHVLITSRPADNSTRSFVAAGIPEDNSGEVEPSRRFGQEAIREAFPEERLPRKLVVKVKQRIIHKTVLLLTFTLLARAHVQLLAERHKKVVARTPKRTLGKGPHSLRLHLDPKHWPTALDFEVHPAGKPHSAGKSK